MTSRAKLSYALLFAAALCLLIATGIAAEWPEHNYSAWLAGGLLSAVLSRIAAL